MDSSPDRSQTRRGRGGLQLGVLIAGHENGTWARFIEPEHGVGRFVVFLADFSLEERTLERPEGSGYDFDQLFWNLELAGL